jgi:hypothetical protein
VEGHRGRRAGLIAALVLGLAAGPAPAWAASDAVGAGVDPSGVTITIVRWQGQDRVHATAVDGGADPTGCAWAVVPAPLGVWPPVDIGPRPPGAHLALLTCNGVGVVVIWVGPHNTVDLEAEVRRWVEEYVARVPVPDLEVHANPQPGLVGVESWAWAEGYDGEPIVDRIQGLGVTVDVRIEPTPVTWSFGDGTTARGGLGAAWPARSGIRHVYTTHGTRPLGAALDLVPRYRIEATAWQSLPPIAVADERSYRVREAVAIIVDRRGAPARP